MDPIQKFFYTAFCINFCSSNTVRRILMLLHMTIAVSIVAFVYYNRLLTMPIAISLSHSRAVCAWFLCYMAQYIVILVEGFLKDSKFTRKYHNAIQVICEKHSEIRSDYDAWFVGFVVFFDLVYLVFTHYSVSEYQSFHDGCMLSKFTSRIRLWSYLHLCTSVLREFNEVIKKVGNVLENDNEADFRRIQKEYSDLWMISQFIGDYYVWSLCVMFFHTFLDNVLYIFWLLTEDFNDPKIFVCKSM